MHSTVPLQLPPQPKPAYWPLPRLRAKLEHAVAGPVPLPPALKGELRFASGFGPRLALYMSIPACEGAHDRVPLVLVHSVNAAASAAEMRPVFDRYSATRPVVAVELPGFGSSERGPQEYTPFAMADAILRTVKHLRREGFAQPVDLMAVSLSSEFAAMAALAKPGWFRSVALVSPTGLESRRPEPFDEGATRENRFLRRLLESPLVAEPLYRMLTTPASVRYFLKRAWGTSAIDEGLLEYGLLTVRRPGARHAPLAFIAGALFTRGIASLYARLPLPLWIAHGVRGGFTGYAGLARMPVALNRTVDVFGTGALPYFETPALFMSRYEAFLHGAALRVAS